MASAREPRHDVGLEGVEWMRRNACLSEEMTSNSHSLCPESNPSYLSDRAHGTLEDFRQSNRSTHQCDIRVGRSDTLAFRSPEAYEGDKILKL